MTPPYNYLLNTALYANGAQDPSFKYTLKPYPSDVIQKGMLKIDGQVMNYSASALAPKQTEPPFVITQLVVLVLFIGLTIVAAKRFRGAPIHTA